MLGHRETRRLLLTRSGQELLAIAGDLVLTYGAPGRVEQVLALAVRDSSVAALMIAWAAATAAGDVLARRRALLLLEAAVLVAADQVHVASSGFHPDLVLLDPAEIVLPSPPGRRIRVVSCPGLHSLRRLGLVLVDDPEDRPAPRQWPGHDLVLFDDHGATISIGHAGDVLAAFAELAKAAGEACVRALQVPVKHLHGVSMDLDYAPTPLRIREWKANATREPALPSRVRPFLDDSPVSPVGAYAGGRTGSSHQRKRRLQARRTGKGGRHG